MIAAEEEILLPEAVAYRPFLSTEDRAPGPDTTHVRLVVRESPRAQGRVIFESDAIWSILEYGARRTLVGRYASEPIFAVHLEPGSGGEVLVECSPGLVAPGPPRAIRSPVHYPVDQILAMYLLGRQGLLLHAAGMLVRGRAVVLPGVSGAGKTTFAGLAAGRAGWEALSDDRVLVRVPDDADGAVAHGTPWPGEGRVAANRSGPLGRLVFLSQGGTNTVQPLTPAQAAARLLVTTSVPWYDPDHLDRTLEACDRLVRRVPATLLTFRPDQEAVDLVERLADEARPVDSRG